MLLVLQIKEDQKFFSLDCVAVGLVSQPWRLWFADLWSGFHGTTLLFVITSTVK